MLSTRREVLGLMLSVPTAIAAAATAPTEVSAVTVLLPDEIIAKMTALTEEFLEEAPTLSEYVGCPSPPHESLGAVERAANTLIEATHTEHGNEIAVRAAVEILNGCGVRRWCQVRPVAGPESLRIPILVTDVNPRTMEIVSFPYCRCPKPHFVPAHPLGAGT